MAPLDRPAYKIDGLSRELPIEFELRGLTWRLSADPDIEVMATMTLLEDKLKGVKLENVDDESGRTLIDYMVAARQLIIDLLTDWGEQAQPVPDAKDFRISTEEILKLFAYIAGSETVADAVSQAITAGVSGARNLDEFDPDLPGARAEEAAETPLPSATHSSAPSSS